MSVLSTVSTKLSACCFPRRIDPRTAFKAKLETAGYEVLWPGDLFATGEKVTAKQIMEADRDALLSCDVVVALLDGAQVDDGTAWEIGYAYAKGIPVIGLRTDFRLCADSDGGLVNAMIQGSVLCMCRSADEVLGVLGTLRNNVPDEKKSPESKNQERLITEPLFLHRRIVH